MINFDIQWPECGDRAFLDNNNGSEAQVSVIAPTFDAYATSYQTAAKLLVEHRNSLPGWNKDLQILPIAFLYRQHIELLLKAIIKNGDDLRRIDRLSNNMHHNLTRLWAAVEQVITENGYNTDPDAQLAAQKVIAELAKADPGSVAFRYPIGTKGTINLEEWERVSVDNFANVMRKLSNFLQSVLYELYHTESYH